MLDSVRGLAVLAVVVTHVSGDTRFNSNNRLGALTERLDVSLTAFFVLSGFLLYRPYVAARLQGRPPVPAVDYVRRRLLRIVPGFWVALTLLALWPGLPAFWDGPWWRSYSFTQIYWTESVIQGIFPSWSLAVEMSFYLLLPLLAWLVGRLAGRRWRLEVGLLAGAALVLLLLRPFLRDGRPAAFHATLPFFLDWLLVGMALAVLSVAWSGREDESRILASIGRRPWVPWAGAAAVFLVFSGFVSPPDGANLIDRQGNLIQHATYAVATLLFLLPAVFGADRGGWPRRLLAWPVLTWLGVVSYGMFLYHGPLMLWLDHHGGDEWLPGSPFVALTLVTVPVTIVAGALSYYVVELPFLRRKAR